MLMGESVIGERGWVTMIRATVTRVCDAMFVSAERTLSGGGLSYPFSVMVYFYCLVLNCSPLYFFLPAHAESHCRRRRGKEDPR